jgi:hypothetical protein
VDDALNSVRGIVSSLGALVATTAYDAWVIRQPPVGLRHTHPSGLLVPIRILLDSFILLIAIMIPRRASSFQWTQI